MLAIVMSNNDKLNVRHGIMLEKVGEFCYLGDILGADGGCYLAVNGDGHQCLEKFCENLPVKVKEKDRPVVLRIMGLIVISGFRGTAARR